jgi:hypothetical protein
MPAESFEEVMAFVNIYDKDGKKLTAEEDADPDWITIFMNPDAEFELVEEEIAVATGEDYKKPTAEPEEDEPNG